MLQDLPLPILARQYCILNMRYYNSILLQLDKRHHVYRFQLKFSDAESAVFFCECDMQHAWDVLPSIITSSPWQHLISTADWVHATMQ